MTLHQRSPCLRFRFWVGASTTQKDALIWTSAGKRRWGRNFMGHLAMVTMSPRLPRLGSVPSTTRAILSTSRPMRKTMRCGLALRHARPMMRGNCSRLLLLIIADAWPAFGRLVQGTSALTHALSAATIARPMLLSASGSMDEQMGR